MASKPDSLQALTSALEDFLEGGATSVVGEQEEPLQLDDVLPGGAIYEAVTEVQQHYPRAKLPSPHARNPWRSLLSLAQHPEKSKNLQNDLHELAGLLLDWASSQLPDLNRQGSLRSISSCLPRFAEAYAEGGSDSVNIVAIRTESGRVPRDTFEKIRSAAGPSMYCFGGLNLRESGGSSSQLALMLHWHSMPKSVDFFLELASEAGALVLSNDLANGLSSVDGPAELWAITVFRTLSGTGWEHTIDKRATMFPALPASIETLKRLEHRRAKTAPVRIYIDDIDSFEKVRCVSPERVVDLLDSSGFLNLEENKIQLALETVLSVPLHKNDWGGEENDLYTSNLVYQGQRHASAFALKGRGTKRKQLEISDCGKNGDQLVRLFQSPAEILVVQYVGNVSESVIKDVTAKTVQKRRDGPAWCCIIDGQDTARLLRAYNKL